MSLCILSAAPESSSSGFATSLAIILGVLARRPTLLVDFNKPQQTRKALGVDDAKGTETLYYVLPRNSAAVICKTNVTAFRPQRKNIVSARGRDGSTESL